MEQELILKGIKLYSNKEEFESLPLDQKQRHYETVIRKMLENDLDGTTTSTILNLIPYFNEKTIQKYLDKLVNTNFAYKKLVGRTYVYFHNGRLAHEVLSRDLIIGKKTYSFYYIHNPEERAIFIEEKKKDELGALSISGGIMVKTASFSEFIEKLKEIFTEIKTKEGYNGN